MPGRLQILLAVTLCSCGAASAQELPALFGISVGSNFNRATKDYTFVGERSDGDYFTRRRLSNPEYVLQGVEITKSSNVIFKIDGRMKTGAIDTCLRVRAETKDQLSNRYPWMRWRIDDAGGTVHYSLAGNRPGCSYTVTLPSKSLQVGCSSYFAFYCERLSNAFIIEAGDTGYSEIARREARERATKPDRSHVD